MQLSDSDRALAAGFAGTDQLQAGSAAPSVSGKREKFEAWDAAHWDLDKSLYGFWADGTYKDRPIQCRWETWQAVAASIESIQQDAERYRWLREQPNNTNAPRIDVVRWTQEDEASNSGEGLRLDALDAAIDAARTALGGAA